MKNFRFALVAAALLALGMTDAAQAQAILAGKPDSTGLAWWWDAAQEKGLVRKFQRMDAATKQVENTAQTALTTAKTALSKVDSLAKAKAAAAKATGTSIPTYRYLVGVESGKAAKAWAEANGLASEPRQKQVEAFTQALFASLGSAPPTPPPAAKPPAATPADSVAVGSPAPAPVVLDSTAIAAVTALVDRLVNARLDSLVQADKDLRADIQDVAHVTATALGAKDPTTGKSPSGKEEKAARDWLARF